MYEFLKNLDRRWIFLLMLLAVAIPILGELTFPEKPTGLAQAVFDEIEALDPGDKVLMAWDFDPASEGELGPMATSFTYHCATKGLKLYYMSLWPVGPQMVDDNIANVIKTDFPDLVYGVDYVNLGYKSGYEGVIKVIITDIRGLYTTDAKGTSIRDIPMMRGIENIQQMDLIINISAGYAGTTEWVLFAVTPYPDIRLVAGVTGVQAPLLYPYIPEQLPGLLGAIKGAAEYEKLVDDKYGDPDHPDPKYLEGKRRMGPQLVAHVLMIVFIVVGNVIYFMGKRRGESR